MKNIFSINENHSVKEANINYYATPFVHPKRIMKEYDFIYMISGEWKIGQNDESFNMIDDTVLILSANKTHFGISPCSPGTKTMYFHVLCSAHEENDLSEITLESLTDVSQNKNVKHIFAELVNCKLSGNQTKADIYFKLLLCELNENHLHSADNSIASKIKNIIHSTPEKFFTNAELAKTVNVSVKTAENKFKATFGTTIHQYILAFKIDEAISYFELFPEITIKETAFNLGFYDEYHFSKQFKKIIGISPAEYKKRQKC